MEETEGFAKEKSKSIDLLCSMRELSTLYDIKKCVVEKFKYKPETEYADGWNDLCIELSKYIDKKIKELKQE